MKIAMDSVGRLVVPKALRAELGITGPTKLEVVTRDGLAKDLFRTLDVGVGELPSGLGQMDVAVLHGGEAEEDHGVDERKQVVDLEPHERG